MGERVVVTAWQASERAKTPIRKKDLARLSRIAEDDLQAFYDRGDPKRRDFASRFLCRALCQGGAWHYLDPSHGLKDFDVFTFFARSGARQFPPRRHGRADFGRPSRFGRHPDDQDYEGRRVDLFGRSIEHRKAEDFADSLRRYLRERRTATAHHLSRKPVVLIDPPERRGEVIWNPLAL